MNRFVDEDMDFVSIGAAICNNCLHKTIGTSTCEAFTDGIPDEILTGEFDHHKSYEGDKGIQFKNIRAP